MNHLFHYYVTYFLAKKNRFTDAESATLAYAAQYVDHSIVPYAVRLPGGHDYHNEVTHHFGFWNDKQERAIWMPFHFFPSGLGDDETPEYNRRKDGKWSPSVVTPHSAPAKEMLVAALKTRNLYRVGIALHTWADTWAHQNFLGRRDDLNKVPGALPLPPVGHAQVESTPDRFSLRWFDGRLAEGQISNRSRFLEAARSIHKYLATFQGLGFDNADNVIAELESVIGPEYAGSSVRVNRGIQGNIREGIGRLKSAISGGHGDEDSLAVIRTGTDDKEMELNFRIVLGIEAYDRHAWRRRAFTGISDKDSLFDPENTNDKALWLRNEILSRTGFGNVEVTGVPDFEESDFYRWSEAAKEHRRFAEGIISNALK